MLQCAVWENPGMNSLAPNLPALDPLSQQHTERVAAYLRDHIARAGGWTPFDDWMAQALYAPGLGYYAAGSVKLAGNAAGSQAPAGDFVTAPELTPLFAQTIAREMAPVLQELGVAQVLEFGAGTGALAADLLDALEQLGLQASYSIVEVSADLRERQRVRLARFGDRVRWLDTLPQTFEGCVVGNEVLDAMPVKLFCWGESSELLERGVGVGADGSFVWADRPAGDDLTARVVSRMPPLPGYVSEINLQGEAFVQGMGDWLVRGVAFLFDYGFPQREFFHPQRAGGTLMCHLRHVAHADPLVAVGVQDITAHVDFTAMADAALKGGLDVLGYTSQGTFLLNAGLADILGRLDAGDVRAYAQAVAPVQKLVSQAEMGELFKVLALGREVDMSLAGFARGDRRHML